MRLAELQGPGQFKILTVDVPKPAPDEVLVEVDTCGVCSSELSAWDGGTPTDYPVWIGHEVSGRIVETGSAVTGFSPGQHVAVWTVGSGFAEFVAVRADYCRLVADDVSLEQALAEPIACAANAVELADIRLADDVVIIGAGFMGNLVQQLVMLRGARSVVVADTRPDALALARSFGATHTVNTVEESLTGVVRSITDGAGADVTFEVTGAQGPLEMVGDVTRMSGKIALVGFHQGPPRKIPLASWNWMAFQLVNAHFRDVATIMRGMSVGMRLLNAGLLHMAPLISHRFDLDDINEAFRVAIAKPEGFVKAVISMKR